MRFWLDQHVDGFHVTNAAYLVEGDLADSAGQTFQSETFEFITELREVLDEYTKLTEKYKYGSIFSTLCT